MKDLPVTDVEKAFEKKNQHSLMAKQPSLQEWKGMEWMEQNRTEKKEIN